MNNSNQTEIFVEIEQAIRDHASQLTVPTGTTQDDVYQCIRTIMRENPDIFWFSHQWKYTEDDHTIRFHYTIDKEKSAKAKVQIEDVIQNDFRISEVFHLSVPEQVMYVYKWIALYCKYNIYSAYNQTIYSVFVCRNSVCTGYAKAAQYLFKVLGIESRLVFGTMHNAEKGSRHCWLVVNVNGLWYHFDPTFAVPEINDLLVKAGVIPVFGAEGLVYNYFCCDTKTIKQSRTIEDEETLPVCSSSIDYTPLQQLPVTPHRAVGAERLGVKGCLLSDSGSSASVYLWHSAINDQRVLKVYKHDDTHELLWHECRIMREMAASHAVLHACGVTDKQDGLIIEQATPLADLLCSHYYQLSAGNFCELLLDVLVGIHECIKHRIYYRDIHLNNIYRTSQGRYVLGDFGSCIWMDRDNPENRGGIGSPWYMAPETYTNGSFDERSATYGIGMLAFFLLNDLFPPLWAEYKEDSLQLRISGKETPAPAILEKPSCAFEQQLASVIKKALAYAPEMRYQKLDDLEKAIKQCASLVEDDDYILIAGGSSERLAKFDENGKIVGRDYPPHEFISKIKCPYCGAKLTVKIKNAIDVDTKNVTCPICHQKSLFRDFKQIVDNSNDEILQFDRDECCSPPLKSSPNTGSTKRRGRIDDFATTDLPLIPSHGNQYDEESSRHPNFHSTYIEGSDVLVSNGKSEQRRGKIRCPNGHVYDSSIYGNQCPLCPSPVHTSTNRRINDFATTAAGPYYHKEDTPTSSPREGNSCVPSRYSDEEDTPKSYQPRYEQVRTPKGSAGGTFWSRIFGKKKEETKGDEVYSSIFAPSEVKPKSHLMVQVYLHLLEEASMVERFAVESDKKAERRGYQPLQTRLKVGDVVNVELNVYGESLLSNASKVIRWQGKFTKCSFDYFVPANIALDELSCEVNLYVNGALVGDMRFITNIVEQPRKLNSEIISRMFKRIFISYAHQDSVRVKDFALAYKAQGVDYFFDRDKLAAGDVYEEKIFEYIDTADLFILCWSANAANSEYVRRECRRAMLRAYPQLSRSKATLKIYPISIEPRAKLPKDMEDIYNFEEV